MNLVFLTISMKGGTETSYSDKKIFILFHPVKSCVRLQTGNTWHFCRDKGNRFSTFCLGTSFQNFRISV